MATMESRKQAVSIRMSSSDVRKIKRLADRLGVRDSDIIRYAVKSMLARLGPLHDPMIRGRNLVPVFLDCEPDLFRQFDLDAARLESIINDGVEAGGEVAHRDVQLIAMHGGGRNYLRWSLGAAATGIAPRPVPAVNGTAWDAGQPPVRSNGVEKEDPEEADEGVSVSVRTYLFQKYVYGDGGAR
jgi:hypothetical protein